MAGSVALASSGGGDVDSEYVAAKYRAQAPAVWSGTNGDGYESIRLSSLSTNSLFIFFLFVPLNFLSFFLLIFDILGL